MLAASFLLPRSSAFLSLRRSAFTGYKEIADASFLFACREFSSKTYVRYVRSDGGWKQSSRKRTASGKTSEGIKGTGPSLSGGKPLESTRQEAILALFSRIQSSIAKENSSERTRMVAKIEAEDIIPKRKQVRVGKGLKGPAERALPQRSSRRNDAFIKAADLSKGDIEISRPISKFVKRSPIPVERKEKLTRKLSRNHRLLTVWTRSRLTDIGKDEDH